MHGTSIILAGVFLLLLLSWTYGSIIYRSRVNQTTTVTIRANKGLPWDNSAFAKTITPTNPIRMLALDQVYGTYNPCDATTIEPTEFASMFPNGEKWIAYVRYEAFNKVCGGTPPHFYYIIYAIRWGQIAGASAFFSVSFSPSTEGVMLPGGIDINKQTYNGLAITVSALAVSSSVASAEGKLQANILDHPSDWEIIGFSDDPSIDSDITPLRNIFGWWRIIWTLQGIYVTVLCLFICHSLASVLAFFDYGKDPKTVKQLRLRLLVLIPELLGGLARILFCIDPLGVFWLENFIFSRSMLNLAATLTVFTNIVTMFFCYDVYRLFKSSRSMQKTESLATKHPWIEPAIIGVAFLLVIMDTTVSIMSLNGYGGSGSIIIPAVYQLIMNLLVLGFALRLNCLSLEEINLMKASIKEKETANAKAASLDFLNRSLNKFDRTRLFMMRAIGGVALGVLALLLIAGGVIYINSLIYGIVMQLTVFALNVIMTFQVLAASELPAKDAAREASTMLTPLKASTRDAAASSRLAGSIIEAEGKVSQAHNERDTIKSKRVIVASTTRTSPL